MITSSAYSNKIQMASRAYTWAFTDPAPHEVANLWRAPRKRSLTHGRRTAGVAPSLKFYDAARLTLGARGDDRCLASSNRARPHPCPVFGTRWRRPPDSHGIGGPATASASTRSGTPPYRIQAFAGRGRGDRVSCSRSNSSSLSLSESGTPADTWLNRVSVEWSDGRLSEGAPAERPVRFPLRSRA